MAHTRTDPQPPDRSYRGSSRGGGGGESTTNLGSSMAAEAGAPEGLDLLEIIGQADQISKDYQLRLEPQLSRAYRAYNNEHAQGSKYLGPAFRGRSRLFVPKTRSAVRKNQATTVAAFFGTEDVVNVSAEYQDDDTQRAAAATMKAAMEIRMTRSSLKSGMPWYQILAGAALDAQRQGVVISKQHWRYEEVPSGEYRQVMKPAVDEGGQMIMEMVPNPVTGQAALQPVMEPSWEPVMRVIEDRPMVTLVPIENVSMDPAAEWMDPAQMGRWLLVRYPMGLSDVRSWMASAGKGGADPGWLQNVPDELLLKGRIDEDRSGSRRVREGGSDRYQDGRAPRRELDIVWVQENFIRISGIDYHFWSVSRFGYLSRVRPVWEAYPELEGERPYIMGVAQIDSHRVFPMSPVESWQPLQLELNDVTNLRQDTLKRAIAPLTVVKAGARVDAVALQRRGQPEATITVQGDPSKDIVFQQTPGPTGASYTETSVNNAMFDELAGVFSTSSVQTSRQLNETVGGMRLMSGSANAVSEYDLRTFVETWAERVLRQILHLERKLESDERIIAAAGRKAQVLKDFGVMPTLTDWDATEVMLRVNAGIGALDPMQRLAKLKMAGDFLAPMMPMMAQEGIKPNYKAFIEEVMGGAGFKDGQRFFEFGEPAKQGPDPEVQKIMAQIQSDQQMQARELQASLKELMLNLQSDQLQTRENNQTKVMLERMKGGRELIGHVASAHEANRSRAHDRAVAHAGRVHEVGMSREQRQADRLKDHETRAADRTDTREARAHEADQAERDHAARAPGPAGKSGRSGRRQAGAGPAAASPAASPAASGTGGAQPGRSRIMDILSGASGAQPGQLGQPPSRIALPPGPDAGSDAGMGGLAPQAAGGGFPGALGQQGGQQGAQQFGQQQMPPQGGGDMRLMLLRALMQQLIGQQQGGQGAPPIPLHALPSPGGRPNAF